MIFSVECKLKQPGLSGIRSDDLIELGFNRRLKSLWRVHTLNAGHMVMGPPFGVVFRPIWSKLGYTFV